MTAMATTELTLRKCSDGYYRTTWRDDAGKAHSRSFGKVRNRALNRFSTFREQWRNDPSVRNPHDGGVLTVRRAWELYEEHARAYYRDADGNPTAGYDGISYSIAVALELFADLPARSFGPSHLRACQAKMLEDGLVASTINWRCSKIRQVFKWLASQEKIPASTWHGLQAVSPVQPGRGVSVAGKVLVPKSSAPVNAVPDAHVWAAMKHLPPSICAMIQFQYWTGCRPQDVCRLRPIDLDTTGKVWIYSPPKHKTAYRGRLRQVLVGPKAQEAIAPYLQQPGPLDRRLFTPEQAERERDEARRAAYDPGDGYDYREFPSYQKRAAARAKPKRYAPEWRTNSYARAIARVCKEHGIPQWSPNQLRHNAATRLRREFGLDVVQVVLGHASADITQVYAQADLERAARAMERVG